jgi:putative addiction module component (TIGR02574 family)
MKASLKKLVDTALDLPEDDRVQLIDALIDSVSPEEAVSLDEAWLKEIERRSAEVDAGLVKPVPWEDVKKRLLRKSRRHA